MTGTGLADRLYGLGGNDVLRGLNGADRLWGGDGDDRITGGNGRDDINTGAGDDVIIFASTRQGGDVVGDFGVTGEDSFALSAAGFDHTAGGLLRGEFQASNAGSATRAGVRVYYDRDDHRLYYDADGSGAGAAVVLAELQTGATVTAADISFF